MADTTKPTVSRLSLVSATGGQGGLLNVGDVVTVGVTMSEAVVVTGTAEAGATVTVYSGTTALGTATANGSGAWSYTLSGDNLTTLGQGQDSITAKATDVAGNLSAASAAFSFNVATQPPAAPVISSAATASFAENGTGVVYTAAGTANAGGAITYGLSGTDAGLFNINTSTGALSFKAAPNFEVPGDSGGNNVYDVTVTATEAGNGNVASKAVVVTVTDVVETSTLSMPSFATQSLQSFYLGVGQLKLAEQDANYFDITSPSSTAVTALDTTNGSLVAMSAVGEGRIAVIGSDDLVDAGLVNDPSAGGIAGGIFNLMSWLANEQRSVDEQRTLHVFSLAGAGSNGELHMNQSLFWEYINDTTSYSDGSTAAVTDYQAVDRYSEALKPNGLWTRDYDVVVLRADAQAAEVALVRQWVEQTGGGLLIEADPSITQSASITALLAEINIAKHSGTHVVAGDYTPTHIDPTQAGYVRTEISGRVSATDGTTGHPIFVNQDLVLPHEIMGGEVTWTSLNTDVIRDNGTIVGNGAATLRALVTFADGTTQVHTFEYSAFTIDAGTGLSLRIVDAQSINAADTSIDAFLKNDILSQVPLSSTTAQNVSWTNSQGYPAGSAGADALWVFSGYLIPQVSGSHQIKLTADDSARFFLSGHGTKADERAVWWAADTETVDLVAGQAYQVWVFFKPSVGGGNDVNLSWALPGNSSFETIPTSAFAVPPVGLLSASAGFPADYLPFEQQSAASVSTLSSTVVIAPEIYSKLYGNDAPVATAQAFDFSERNMYFDIENLTITDAVAAQARTLSIKLTASASGANTIELVNFRLESVTDGHSLAQNVQAALNAVSGERGAGISVSYDTQGHRLVVSDPVGRSVSNFVLGKSAELQPTVLSGAMTVVSVGDEAVSGGSAMPSVVKIHFNPADALAGTRLSLGLNSANDANDVNLVDLAHNGLGFAGMDTFAQYLQDSLARHGLAVTLSWDDATQNLVFSDPLGRQFTDAKVYTTPAYEPLVIFGGDATVNGATEAVLGTLGGTVQAVDNNGDALTYTILEGSKFGTVSLDQHTGKWSYAPNADGAFQGWDQFTVVVSDGHGGTTAPVAISISDQSAPQEVLPMIRTFTVADPNYTQPDATGNDVPADFQFQDVFVAQTHVQRPDDPYLQLVGNRYVLIKVNATSASGAAAPDLVATVKDSDGNVLGSLRLTGPDSLPTSVDIPTATNRGTQSHSDSYEAPLPAAWIQPGISITVTAGGGSSAVQLGIVALVDFKT